AGQCPRVRFRQCSYPHCPRNGESVKDTAQRPTTCGAARQKARQQIQKRGAAKLAFAAAEKAFKDAGTSDKLRIMVAAGVGHRVTPEQRQAALEWFERWLK